MPLFLFVRYVCRDHFRAIIAPVFTTRLSFLAFSNICRDIPPPSPFPSHGLARLVFPRLSTRHLFAGAIWKFNACALARKITAIPTPTHRARSKLSLVFRPLLIHTHKHIFTITHLSLFRRCRKILTGHYPRNSRWVWTLLCASTRIHVLYRAMLTPISRQFPQNLFTLRHISLF